MMAVKTKDYTVNISDFTSEGYEINGKGKTAIRIDSTITIDPKTLTYTIADNKLVISDGTKSIKVSNYTGIKYIKTDYAKVGKKETYNLFDIIAENKVDNSSNPITQFNAKKFTATSGTNYNDTFDFYDGYTVPTEGKNKDRGLTIKGGKGSDTITGTKGNDKITGGSGTNIINVYTTKAFGNDEVVLTGGENLVIRLSDSTSLGNHYSIDKDGNNLKISIYKNVLSDVQGTITVKNYFKKDVITSSGSFIITSSDNSDSVNVREFINIVKMDLENYTKQSFTGSWANDDINANDFKLYRNGKKITTDSSKGTEITTSTEGYEKTKGVNINLGNAVNRNDFRGSIYADTVKGGNNGDYIIASAGNDTYTLGKGENYVRYSKTYWETETPSNYNTDTINLTKGENLIIHLTDFDFANEEEFLNNAKLKVSGKNLLLTLKKDDTSDYGTIVLKNFAKSDVVGANGSVKVLLQYETTEGAGDAVYVDLKTALLTSDKGTWHNDLIDKSGYEIKKKGAVVADVTKKGLTINGGDGADEIIGSNYSDTIKAGVGTGDNITGGTGNDKLYASTTKGSSTTFNFKAGDGKDTVYSGKGEDTLKFYDINLDTIKFEQGTKKNNKDLIIKYSDNDAVTVKNYYTVNKKGKITGINKNNTIKNIIGNGTNFIIGSELSETFDGTDGRDIIYANGGNDVINPNIGDDVIYVGKGNTTLKVNASMQIYDYWEVDGYPTEGWVDNFKKTVYLQDTDSVLTIDFDEDLYGEGRYNGLFSEVQDLIKTYISQWMAVRAGV